MGIKDFVFLAVTLVFVVLLIVITRMAPVYVLPDNSTERHFVWNAPTKKVAREFDKLTPEQVASFTKDAYTQGILDAMKNQPSVVPYPHYYLGPLGGPGFNVLGYLTALCAVAWTLFAGYKVGRFAWAKIEKYRTPPPKKQSLPYDVRRSRR